MSRMKMTRSHFHMLCEKVLPVVTPEVIEAYETGNFPRAELVKDLQMRFCFDMLYRANVTDLMKELYTYLNDDHIYTALKAALPKIERRF